MTLAVAPVPEIGPSASPPPIFAVGRTMCAATYAVKTGRLFTLLSLRRLAAHNLSNGDRMRQNVQHMFRALVLEGALITTTLVACDNTTDDTEVETDTDPILIPIPIPIPIPKPIPIPTRIQILTAQRPVMRRITVAAPKWIGRNVTPSPTCVVGATRPKSAACSAVRTGSE